MVLVVVQSSIAAWLNLHCLTRSFGPFAKPQCGVPEVVEASMVRFCEGDMSFPANGITSTLVSRLQSIGWHVDSDGRLHDMFGSFSLFLASFEELAWRLEWSWLKCVAAAVAHRPGLQQLDMVDPVKTRQFLGSLCASDAAAYRKLLNGAHITQDGKHYCQEAPTDVCLFCECSDSRFHRFWGCDKFACFRAQIDADLWKAIPDLPESVTCYGWALRPSTHTEWYEYLASVPELSLPSFVPSHAAQIHLFTDGTCLNPHYPDARLAAYAVAIAAPDGLVPPLELDSGPLPGVRQTSVRAETYAILRAVHFAARWDVCIMIWTDCLSVVRRFRKLCQGAPVGANSPNADLWVRICECIRACRVCPEIIKVAAHVVTGSTTTALEEWCAFYNTHVDRLAAAANCRRPPAFWTMFARHLAASVRMDEWNAQIQGVLLAISRQVLRYETDVECDVPEPLESIAAPPWIHIDVCPPLPPQAVRWYGTDVVQRILRWIWTGLGNQQSEVVWISHTQLFIDFACSTGEIGPVKCNGWQNGSKLPLFALQPVSFKTRVRWFSRVCKEIMKHAGYPLQSAYVRPASHMLAMHLGCVALPWPSLRLEAVDKWLHSWSAAPFRRQSKEMEKLPVPNLDPNFPA